MILGVKIYGSTWQRPFQVYSRKLCINTLLQPQDWISDLNLFLICLFVVEYIFQGCSEKSDYYENMHLAQKSSHQFEFCVSSQLASHIYQQGQYPSKTRGDLDVTKLSTLVTRKTQLFPQLAHLESTQGIKHCGRRLCNHTGICTSII